MPICIECRYPLKTLYTTYSKADDRALGKGVRLTQCPRCKRFGDKYVEHDFVVLFIDLVLIKPQVYRHLLFNRLGREDDRFDPSIIRLGTLLLLFDVYLTWARIEKALPPPFSPGNNNTHDDEGASAQSLLSNQPLVMQYMFFLGLCAAQTLAFHLPIRLLCAHPPRIRLPECLTGWRTGSGSAGGAYGGGGGGGGGVTDSPPPHHASTATPAAASPTPAPIPSTPAPNPNSTTPPPTHPPTPIIPTATAAAMPHDDISLVPSYPHPVPLSTALIVSSCTKLFPLLLIIWDYDLPSSASAVSWAVIVNNVAALEILMDCGYLRAGLLVGVGAAVRAVVGELVLASVGLRGRGASAAGWAELGWGIWSA